MDIKSPNFSLIETMLWKKGEFFLLGIHIARLEKSASYFSFPFEKSDILKSLRYHSAAFDPMVKYRVRLLLSGDGKTDISSGSMELPSISEARTLISGKRTDRNDIFLSHKTTNRSLYDNEFVRCREAGYFDIIFTNAEGEVTEGAITNIIVKKSGLYLTPPLSCGVLPGTYREDLLTSQEIPLKEKVLLVEDLNGADEIFLINSVRKMVPVKLTA